MRTKNRIFRQTQLQWEQLEKYLKETQEGFTDFIQSLIQRELSQAAMAFRYDEQDPPPRFKIKTVFEVIKRYQKTDPALLLELAKIGNNLNQIARALNILKNATAEEQRKLDIFRCFHVLKAIQDQIEQLSPDLPKISRQTPDRIKKQLLSLPSVDLIEEDEDAY